MNDRLPFVLDRGGDASLVEQLTDGLRRAIANGFYKPGERLPALRRLAEKVGTSIRVPRQALAILKEEGLVAGNGGGGTVVLEKDRTSYRGRVLLVHGGTFLSYHVDAIYGRITEILMRRRYRVEQILVPAASRGRSFYDFRDLRRNLRTGYDIVVGMGYVDGLVGELAKSGVPYVLVSGVGPRPKGCVSVVANIDRPAMEALSECCLRQRVMSVLQLDFDRCGVDASAALKNVGVGFERLTVNLEQSRWRLDSFWRAAYTALETRLRDVKKARPDLIFFADDYLAEGGLWALAHCGLEAPRDVKVVTLANRGLPMAYSAELAKVESDPFLIGERVSEVLVKFLVKKSLAGFTPVPMTFVPGETFGKD